MYDRWRNLSSGLVEMGAEANIGTSWYEAK